MTLRAEELISVAREDGRVIVRWRGEIDLAIAPAVQERTLEALGNTDEDLMLDLSAVDYLDSSGLRSLMLMRALLDARQLRLVLVLPEGSPLRRALEIGGVARVVPTYPTLEEATTALGGPAAR